MVTCKNAPLVRNYLEVYWPCAGGLSAVNAIGTQLRDPINAGLTRWRLVVLNITMDAAAEVGRSPVCKHQIQPEYGNEQADAGRDCRTRLARPNSQARTRTGKYSFSLFSWPRAGLATLPGWSILLLYVMTIHTYCCIHRSRAIRILLIYSTQVSTCTAESYIQLQ